ncbi:MAG TPA: GNAT family N-acetyltransferase [Rugosibacter sp.]
MQENLHNLIEPTALIRHFLQHPPERFPVFNVSGVPAFEINFNLLTTMASSNRQRFERLPFYRRWKRVLQPRTCFIGATVSEYGLLPALIGPNDFLASVSRVAADYPFLIVKDLPAESVLVGEAAHAYSQAFMDAAQSYGFFVIEGQALAYVSIDFTSIDEFLSRMPKSRRKDIKRKTRENPALVIEQISTGDAQFMDENLLAEYYALYRQVYDQSETHFDLLSPGFFCAVLQDSSCGGIVFTYRVEGKLIGYNLCFVHDGMLLDKYIGFSYPASREHNLYFMSWITNLRYALEKGLRYYVAGWTDPEIKRHLGASFTFTRHAVYIRNMMLRQALRPFKRFFESDRQWHETTRS